LRKKEFLFVAQEGVLVCCARRSSCLLRKKDFLMLFHMVAVFTVAYMCYDNAGWGHFS
jgi:hypothetical protein